MNSIRLANAEAAVVGCDLLYLDPPFNTGSKRTTTSAPYSYLDTKIDTVDFAAELSRIMGLWKPHVRSSVVVHVDPRTSHYVKVCLDRVFGENNFRNEIIWSYNSGGASKRTFAKKHDTLLWYTKDDDYTFNIQREPYATPGVEGRAGFHPDGRMVTDVWPLSILSTTAKERTGYPTQKPQPLLERLILALTDEGDMVADPFCGSGTTAVVAHRLSRQYSVSDINPEAVEVTKRRLHS